MINLYCWGAIGAVFCLVVGAMWGYCRQEAQQVHANALQREHLQAVDAKWRELLKDAEDTARSHHSKWAYADGFRKAIVEYLVVNHIWNFDVHTDDPMAMMAEIIKWETKMALDPLISKAAKNLHTRGVRKGAAKGREQMRKFLMKSIDNQAATIDELSRSLSIANARRMRFTEAVTNVMNDKIALPGVRRAFNQAIIQEHDRLRAVSANKGA